MLPEAILEPYRAFFQANGGLHGAPFQVPFSRRIKGDTRTLDYSSYEHSVAHANTDIT